MAGWGINAAAAAEVDLAVATRGPTPCAYPEREGNRVRKRLTPGRGRGPGGAGPNAETLRPHARDGGGPQSCSSRWSGRAGSAWRECAPRNPAVGFSFTSTPVRSTPGAAPPAGNGASSPPQGRGLPSEATPVPLSQTRTRLRRYPFTSPLVFLGFSAPFPHFHPELRRLPSSLASCLNPAFPAAPAPPRPAQPWRLRRCSLGSPEWRD